MAPLVSYWKCQIENVKGIPYEHRFGILEGRFWTCGMLISRYEWKVFCILENGFFRITQYIGLLLFIMNCFKTQKNTHGLNQGVAKRVPNGCDYSTYFLGNTCILSVYGAL